ncbi:MAG: hypothetical protein JWM34_2410 [Ilumatobacteraceae bacterium]|nr:hypothetical protein [Ilumatobacteraceae bacterium]
MGPPSGRSSFGSTPIDLAAFGMGQDTAPQRRGIRPGWLLAAVLFLAGGAACLVHGIIEIVDINDATVAHAVARAEINGSGNVAQFAAPKTMTYTIYAIIDTSNSNQRDQLIANTSCQIQSFNGGTLSVSGNNQGSSTTIGDVSSIGTFRVPEGEVTVRCDSAYGDRYDYIVSPGTSSVGGAVAFIIGGAFALVPGIIALVKTFGRRRRPSTGSQLVA